MHNCTYMHVEGVTGEVHTNEREGWIHIQHIQWELIQPFDGYSTGSRSGKIIVKEMEVLARIDKAMPSLMKKCASGAPLKVVIAFSKTDQDPTNFLTLSLTDVHLSSVSLEPYTGIERAGETALSAGTMCVKYRFLPTAVDLQYREDSVASGLGAPVTFDYDFRTNKQN